MANEQVIQHRNSPGCRNERDRRCLRILWLIWLIMRKLDKSLNHTEGVRGDPSVRTHACYEWQLVAVCDSMCRIVCTWKHSLKRFTSSVSLNWIARVQSFQSETFFFFTFKVFPENSEFLCCQKFQKKKLNFQKVSICFEMRVNWNWSQVANDLYSKNNLVHWYAVKCPIFFIAFVNMKFQIKDTSDWTDNNFFCFSFSFYLTSLSHSCLSFSLYNKREQTKLSH